MKLSPTMWLQLSRMQASKSPYYANIFDPTCRALERRGLVHYHRARKYGRNCWHLTDAGKAYDLSK